MNKLDSEFKLPFIGESFDTISSLSYKYNMSKYKVRKYINKLIDYGVVEKFGNKFFVISNDFDDSVKATQNRLLNKAKILLHISKYKNNPNYIFNKSKILFYLKNNNNIKYSPILDIEIKNG